MEVAEVAGVSGLVVGTSVLPELMGDDAPLSSYGRVVDSSALLQETKGLKKKVADKKADEKLLVITIQQGKAIVEKLQSQGDGFERLLAILDDQNLAKRFNAWEGQKRDTRWGQLRDLLGRKLADFVREKEGSVFQEGREKYHVTYRISGGKVYAEATSDSGARKNLPPHDLLSYVGLKRGQPIELVLERLFKDDKSLSSSDKQLQAAVALYELITGDPRKEQKVQAGSTATKNGDQKVETLFQRMVEEPPRRRSRRRRRAATVEYKTVSRAKRTAVAAGMLTALIAGGYGAGMGTFKYQTHLYDQATEALGGQEKITDWDKREAQIKREHPILGKGNDALLTIQNEQSDLESTVAIAAIRAGLPISAIEKIADLGVIDYEWLAKNERIEWPTWLDNDSEIEAMALVDESIGKNDEVFHITPLAGDDVTGYWYTGVYDVISTKNIPAYPFTDRGISYQEDYGGYERVSPPQVPPETAKPLFKLTTPFIKKDRATALPIRSKTKIIAANITDKRNPDRTLPVELTYDVKTRLYTRRQ